mgnify:CR=1 FL=1
MSNNPLIPKSKLPGLGTTIFTQMSALAQQHKAINLSQGFPDFDGPDICNNGWLTMWQTARTSMHR